MIPDVRKKLLNEWRQMKEVRNILHILNDITNRYGLKTLCLDFTDITLMSRIGFSSEVFIQIYVNIKKDKINTALVVADERVYGIDKEECSV